MSREDDHGLGLVFDFFIALFGGLYSAAKGVISGISKIRAGQEQGLWEEEQARIDMEKRRLMRLMADDTKAKEVEEFVLYHKERALADVRTDLIGTLGPDWQSIYPIPRSLVTTKSDYKSHLGYWVSRIILSRSGKVSSDDIEHGFPLVDDTMCRHNIELVRKIEHNLRTSGCDVHLVRQKDDRGGHMVFDVLLNKLQIQE